MSRDSGTPSNVAANAQDGGPRGNEGCLPAGGASRAVLQVVGVAHGPKDWVARFITETIANVSKCNFTELVLRKY